ncbi:MAG: flagellar hook-associated protein FlgK [Candidatus Zixiibacteriota bacterium]
MPGLFQGLELGKRALLAHQFSLQTAGHNIANVNTPGYSRQRVSISTTMPENLTFGSVGTGMKADNVRQVRDLFLTAQYREAQKSLGQWSYKYSTLSQIEAAVNEPQDNAVGDLLNGFWDAWSDLSTNADSSSNRSNVVAQANKLVDGIHQLANQLESLRQSIDSDLTNFTNEVNRLTAEIANLNQQIKTAELGGNSANDLRDQRDLLTDQLSQIIDVRTREKANGETMVYMGAMVLVDGSDSFDIGVNAVSEDGQFSHQFVWAGTDVELQNYNGQLSGLLESRDVVIPRYIEQLNELTRTLVEEVNALHVAGYAQDGSTGVAFFDPNFTDAATIRVNNLIQLDPTRVVASQGQDGDNLIALALSELRNKRTMNSNTTSINEYYNSLVGNLGIETHESKSFSENFELLVQQIENQRQAVQGVSLDEEMTNLIKYQHAYDAAARVITTMDEALDVVINGMGIVGRS